MVRSHSLAAGYGIAGKLNWIGTDPICDGWNRRGPLVTFKHFQYFEEDGPLLEEKYPALASHMKNVRSFMHSPSPAGGREVNKISDLAVC